MYGIKRNSRRHIDYRVRAVRHCDDIKDIALKVKAKAQELINEFKAMPTGKKIAIALTKLVKYVSAIYAAKTAKDLIKDIMLINDWKAYILKKTANGWLNSEDFIQAADSASVLKKKLMLKMGIKALIGLVIALVAQVKEKTIKAGLPSDYNKENYPNG